MRNDGVHIFVGSLESTLNAHEWYRVGEEMWLWSFGPTNGLLWWVGKW